MAGVELERCASGHEMSNEQSEKPELPQHKPGSPWENRSLPTTSQLHLFCTTCSLLRTILDSASWWLSQSCDSCAAAFCCRDVGPKWAKWQTHLGRTLVARCQYNFNGGVLAGRTASKTTTAWWLALNSKTMPLFMKCQINNQLKPDNPQDKPGSPWKNCSLPTTSLFRAAWSLLG